MSTMPTISHRLFAAAAGQQVRPRRKPARSATSDWPGPPLPLEAPLEVVIESGQEPATGLPQDNPWEPSR